MSNSNLSDEQITELKQPLDPKKVKHREGGGGKQLAYLRGTDVIDRANEVFGFGGWGYDLISNELFNVFGENGEVIGGYYAARLKLSVYGCMPITDEGVCPVQEGRNPRAKIDAHDMARKGAITDAMKRAFRCFGDQFGNSLYDTDLVDGQPGTERSQPAAQRQQPPTQAARTSATQNPPATSNPKQSPTEARPRPVIPATTPNPAPTTSEVATEQQVQAIAKMAGRKGMDDIQLNDRLTQLYGKELKELTRSDASHFIKVFQDQA